jgi:hypothetical protein
MAAALNQRYGALLRTSTGDSIDAMELKIGEMNQIYPEIWRYLDEARTALAGRGIEVVDYDALRATERPGQLGTESIEVEERFNALGLVTSLAGPAFEQTKTVTYNVEGHRKANAAVHTLKRALPDVDWVALDRAEQAEIAAAGSLTAGNWKQLGLQVAIVAALLGVVVIIYKVLM